MNYASIEGTSHVIHPIGRTYLTYKWIGERHWPVRLDCTVSIDQIPWKLKLVRDDMFYLEYIREDAYFPYGWLLVIRYKAQDIYWHWFNRFMATLNIWGLAYTPTGCVPSWRDIGKCMPHV